MPRFRVRLGTLSVLLSVSLFAASVRAATYYVRVDGGPPDRCTGLADAAAPASGIAQPCAWDHPFRALPPGGTPRIAGGDTLVIGPGSYRMGVGAAGADACDSNGPWDCHLGRLPSGPSAQSPTRLVGRGWDTGCSARPQLWGTERSDRVVDLTGTSNAVVACLEITDRSGCVEDHTGGLACQRNTPPYGDWAAWGLVATDSAGVRLADLDIHGLAHGGVLAGRLTDWTVEDVKIAGNGSVGWDGDVEGSDSNSGNMVFRRFTVEWNGCGETYPGRQPVGCWAQEAGGYGDGFGTGETAGSWLFEDSAFLYNTSDGLDLLYARAGSSITIRRTRAVGNAGNQLKTNGPALIENSLVVGSCGFFHGKSFSFLVDDCRANGNAISLAVRSGDQVRLVNDTIASQGDCLVIAECWGGGCTGTERVTLRNDVFAGYTDYLQPFENTCLVYQETFPQGNAVWDLDYGVITGVKEDACLGAHSACGGSLGIADAQLATFDGHLVAGSRAIDAGLAAGAPSTDLEGNARDASPDIGAYEFRSGSGGGCALACSATVPAGGTAGAAVAFSLSVTPSGCGSGAPAVAWSFGDGASTSGASASHTFAAAGSYAWSATATLEGTTCYRSGTIAISGGSTTPAFTYVFASVTHAPGLLGALFRTDVAAVNRASTAANVTLTFAQVGGGTTERTRTVPAGGTAEWSDVLTSVFGFASDSSAYGALTAASDVPLVLSSRTFNQSTAGTFGAYLPAVALSSALTSGIGILPQLRKSSAYRTNIGVVNLGTASATVAIRLFGGTGAGIGSVRRLTIPAGGFAQETDVFTTSGAGDAAVAYATVEGETPGSRVWAFASVIDNATGDPTIVPLFLP